MRPESMEKLASQRPGPARWLPAVAAVLLLVIQPNSPIWAGHTQSTQSARSDVIDLIHTDAVGDLGDPARRNGDIARVVVSHNSHWLRVVAHYRELAPAALATIRADTYVRTRRGRIGESMATLQWRHRGDLRGWHCEREVALRDVPDNCWRSLRALEQMWGNDAVVPCTNMTTSLDFGFNQVRVRIPRSCLGDPERVRIRFTTYEDGKMYHTHDDGFGDKYSYSRWIDLSSSS